MTLRQLEYFYSVAKCLNYSEAAKQNFVSQPSISKSIMLLEEELGTTLFNRNKHTVELTAAGQVLADGLPALQSQLNQLLTDTRQAGDSIRSRINLRVLDGNRIPEVVRKVMGYFAEKLPQLEINVAKLECGEELKVLESGDADFVITVDFEIDGHDDILRVMPVDSVHSCIAVPKSHPLAKHDSIPLSAFNNEKFIAVGASRRAPGTAIMMRQLEEANCQANVTYVPDPHTMLLMIEAGNGVSIVNRNFYENSAMAIKCIDVPELSDRRIVIAWRRGPVESSVEMFADMLKEQLRMDRE